MSLLPAELPRDIWLWIWVLNLMLDVDKLMNGNYLRKAEASKEVPCDDMRDKTVIKRISSWTIFSTLSIRVYFTVERAFQHSKSETM